MHRTQIQLHDWQYEVLKATSERHGKSISSLIREAVSAFLGGGRGRSAARLAGIEGIGEDDEASGRGHDRFLYGGKPEGT